MEEQRKKLLFVFVFSTYLPVFLLKFRSRELVGCRIWLCIQWVPTLHTFGGPQYPKNNKYLKNVMVLEFQLTRTYFGTFSYKAHFRPQISSNATRIIHLNCITEFIKKENVVFTGLLPLSLWLVDKLKLSPFHCLFNPPHSHFLSSCVHH